MQPMPGHRLSPRTPSPETMILASNGNNLLLPDAGLVLVAVIKLIEPNSGVSMDHAHADLIPAFLLSFKNQFRH